MSSNILSLSANQILEGGYNLPVIKMLFSRKTQHVFYTELLKHERQWVYKCWVYKISI